MGDRSIPLGKYVKALKKQQQQFKSDKAPTQPDPAIFQPGNEEEAAKLMAHWRIEPYWGHHPGTEETGLMFRSIPTSGGLIHIRHAIDNIDLYRQGLGLMAKDDEGLREQIAVVQAKIRKKAGLENAPFATRGTRPQDR